MPSHARLRFEYQDDYEWIRVLDRYPEEHRVLQFETSIQGILNLKDHHAPVLEYIRVMLDGARLLVPNPRSVLIGGLGSCALLHAVEAWCGQAPVGGAVISAVESNARMVDIARRFFRLSDTARVNVGDFRAALDGTDPDSLDVVFVDCYSATAIPPHLTTVEFVQTLHNRLTANGLAVFNFWSPVCNQNVGDQVRGVLEVFGQAAVLACIDDENLIVFAQRKAPVWPQRMKIGKWDYRLKSLDLDRPEAWTYYMKDCQPLHDGAVGERVDGIGIDI